MKAWIKIFVRLWWLDDVEIKYISDKKIIKGEKKLEIVKNKKKLENS